MIVEEVNLKKVDGNAKVIITSSGKKFSGSEFSKIGNFEEIKEYFSGEEINSLNDLKKIEDICDGHISGPALFSIEFAVLKALCEEKNKEIYEVFEKNIKSMPRLMCIFIPGHDFNEFLLVPYTNKPHEGLEMCEDAEANAKIIFKNLDKKFKEDKSGKMETSFDDKRILEVMKDLRDNVYDEKKAYLDQGIDISSNEFHARKKYTYEKPPLKRNEDEQKTYMENLMSNFNLVYLEEPFSSHSSEKYQDMIKKFGNRIFAVKVNSISEGKKIIQEGKVNGLVLNVEKIGSLIDLKELVELGKKNKFKIIIPWENELSESIALGLEADFIKVPIDKNKIRRILDFERKNLIVN